MEGFYDGFSAVSICMCRAGVCGLVCGNEMLFPSHWYPALRQYGVSSTRANADETFVVRQHSYSP
jgi:hypothetical protein